MHPKQLVDEYLFSNLSTYHELPYQQLNLRTLALLVLKGKGYPENFLDTIRDFSLSTESCEPQIKSVRQKDKRREARIERAAVHANLDENARATWPQLIPKRTILSCIEAYHANVQYKRLNVCACCGSEDRKRTGQHVSLADCPDLSILKVTDPYILQHTPTWRFTYIARTLDGLMLDPDGLPVSRMPH
ncbi:hypothetical protein BT96DRAFT_1010003 [Gymnopus androsaceus JB14]|uniref:Uncharacterized protein n=1 Tax=Gymnopus androsaceus JB14 TaxID=1447944 RepID=A0A6A4GBP6_9AGAR|nr:hypothetical protein BT96DRAFT_1010003 [Gymnopus androsaceus JB14]